MWLVLDRIEADAVILQDENEALYTLTVQEYTALTGDAPVESLVLEAQVADGRIRTLIPSPEKTERRMSAARERLRRLAARPKKWS